EVGHLLFETLTTSTPPSGSPRLAQSWTVSPDGLTYTFTLRAGAVYSDGQPLTAHDFVYAFERLLDPALGTTGAPPLAGIEGAHQPLARKPGPPLGIRALDDHRLEIRLTSPDPSFPLHLALPQTAPLPASHASRAGDRLRVLPLGGGPFVLEQWQ